MLIESFIFLDKVGRKTEQHIWQQDVPNWQEFRERKSIPSFSSLRKGYYDRQLEKAEKALRHFDVDFFTQKFPASETWRLYETFQEDAVFLDIETSGWYGDITVIGLHDGEETKTMVRGFNFGKEMLKQELSKYKLLITFNGSSFDLPVLKRYFQFMPKLLHIDLRFVCRSIGLTGGLKAIERMVGMKRAEEIEHITGEDAVYLWNMWKISGEQKYLDLLVQYNEADCMNLKPLADFAVKELWKRIREQSF